MDIDIVVKQGKIVISKGNSSAIQMTFEEARAVLLKLTGVVVDFSRLELEDAKKKCANELRSVLGSLESVVSK